MGGKGVIITEGERPIWQLVIAAVFYTAIITLLFLAFVKFEFGGEVKKMERSLGLFKLAMILLPIAMMFSVVRNILFDLGSRRYKIEYCVGPIKIGKWKSLPNIEYVSVFKQPKRDGEYIYETNLWYKDNRHFNIYENKVLESAYEMGENVARILKIKLLDATVPNNNKWVKP